MGVICNVCGGEFSGAGPGPEWPHDTTKCAGTTPQKLRKRIASLEEENRRLRQALEQVIAWEGAIELVAPELGGAIKAMWNARAALSQEEQ